MAYLLADEEKLYKLSAGLLELFSRRVKMKLNFMKQVSWDSCIDTDVIDTMIDTKYS
jgi:hypothetical protein